MNLAVSEWEWWLADRERWGLLAFDGDYQDGLPFDRNSDDRETVLDGILTCAARPSGAADFARYLLDQEIRWHSHSWGFGDSLEMAALLVAEEQQVADVWLLWNALTLSFDTWCGLPHQLPAAAGRERVTAHVAVSQHRERSQVLEHLAELEEDDAEVAELLASRRRYHARAQAN